MLSKEGEGPVGEPIRRAGLPALLAEWDPLDEESPEIEDVPPRAEDVFDRARGLR
jgi:hypothetical protein